jgi:DNA-binding HxlR family transcriptional regulator
VKRKKIEFRSQCPVSTALDIFGDKWSLLILRDLIFKNKSTYGEFLDTDEKIATNILADRLAMLEAESIITKNTHPENKVKMLYKLTAKGIDLIPVLVEIIMWSEKYHDVHPHAIQFVKTIKKDKEGLIEGIKKGLKKK